MEGEVNKENGGVREPMWPAEHLAHTGLQHGRRVFTVRRRDPQLLLIDALIFRRK